MKTLEINGKTVTFGEKNVLQRDNCLWSACPVGRSTQEARCGIAAIRCCENEKCMEWAARFAAAASGKTPIAQA